MVDVEADSDVFANGMIVVRGYERKNSCPACQSEGVQEFGATEGAVHDFGLQFTAVVVNNVVRTQHHFNMAALAAGIAALHAFKRQARFEQTEFDLDTMVVDDRARQEYTLRSEEHKS